MSKTNFINLTYQLALTEFKLKYEGSILGYLWSLVKPLLLFGVLYIIFTFFIRLGKGVPNYPVYLLLGIVMFTFFSDATMTGMHSILERGDLIRKINFPKITIVIASVLTAFLTFLLNLIIVAVFLFFSKITPRIDLLIFIPLILELFFFSLGVSFILATLFTRFRDFAHIWEVSLQVLFYATPILYPISLIPKQLLKLMLLNPLAQIFQDSRWALISSSTDTSWKLLTFRFELLSVLFTIVIFFIGLVFFSISAKNFAEEI